MSTDQTGGKPQRRIVCERFPTDFRVYELTPLNVCLGPGKPSAGVSFGGEGPRRTLLLAVPIPESCVPATGWEPTDGPKCSSCHGLSLRSLVVTGPPGPRRPCLEARLWSFSAPWDRRDQQGAVLPTFCTAAYEPPFSPVWDPILVAARKAATAVRDSR